MAGHGARGDGHGGDKGVMMAGRGADTETAESGTVVVCWNFSL